MVTTPAETSTHIEGGNEHGEPDEPFRGSKLQQNGFRLDGMLVHDIDFQEMARQQMMEGSGKMRAQGGSLIVRLMADSQPPARPFL